TRGRASRPGTRASSALAMSVERVAHDASEEPGALRRSGAARRARATVLARLSRYRAELSGVARGPARRATSARPDCPWGHERIEGPGLSAAYAGAHRPRPERLARRVGYRGEMPARVAAGARVPPRRARSGSDVRLLACRRGLRRADAVHLERDGGGRF